MLNYIIHLSLILLLTLSLETEAKETPVKDLTESIDLGEPSNWGIRGSNGLELSHQRTLEDHKRLEFNTGLSTNHRRKDYDFILNGAYQWIYPLSDVDEIKWYTGANLHCGYYDLRTNTNFNLGLGGQIGIEYFGYTPLQFTLDLRPVFYLFDGRNLELNVGLGLRYFLK